VLDGKKILITGGTGSFGQALTRKLLKTKVDTIRIFSRNENKQVTMSSEFNDDRLRFLIGDIRDLPRLTRAMEDIDVVFHAAALKHVPIIEYNPFEAVKTNVIGAQNVIDACIETDVEKAVGIGTDKAVSPLNSYGASKLLMEKLFVSANNFLSEKHKTKFIAVRYGNVFGSSGSILPLLIQQIKNKQKITLTDLRMTRFSILMEEALDLVLDAVNLGKGSEIFIPKLRAYNIEDLKDAVKELYGDFEEKIIGIRPGEKLNEVLINEEEIRYAWELSKYYVLFSPFFKEEKIKESHPGIRKINQDKLYSSDKVERFSKEDLKELVKQFQNQTIG